MAARKGGGGGEGCGFRGSRATVSVLGCARRQTKELAGGVING
jgi:hypothetical protein